MPAFDPSDDLAYSGGPAIEEYTGTGSEPPATPESVLYAWDVMDYAGISTVKSGTTTGTLEDAKAAAKAALDGATEWFIIIRTGGAVAYSEGSDAGAGQGKEHQQQGEGGADDFGQGYGQIADMAFRFRLMGWKWTWTSKTGDPRLWTGSGAVYQVQASEYTYGSAADALSAGKAVGDANEAVLQVYAESNYPHQFAGLYYLYAARDQAAKNAPALEKDAAYIEWIKTKDLVIPPAPPGPGVIPEEAIGAAVAVLAVVTILGVIYAVSKGA